jgi:hypothetical protein
MEVPIEIQFLYAGLMIANYVLGWLSARTWYKRNRMTP